MKLIRYVKDPDRMTFSKCGLNIHKNFLQAPECPCGCGSETHLVLDGIQEAANACGGILLENECCQCGIFVIFMDGDILFALKNGEDEDGLTMFTSTPPVGECNYEQIGELADKCELHQYGLMVEVKPGEFKIIEE